MGDNKSHTETRTIFLFKKKIGKSYRYLFCTVQNRSVSLLYFYVQIMIDNGQEERRHSYALLSVRAPACDAKPEGRGFLAELGAVFSIS